MLKIRRFQIISGEENSFSVEPEWNKPPTRISNI